MNSQVGLYTKWNRSRKARAFSQLEAEDKLFESQEPEAGIQMPESRLRLPTDVRLKNPQMWKTLAGKKKVVGWPNLRGGVSSRGILME